MNSSLATDYWISVFQISFFKESIDVNSYFSNLQTNWLGGTYEKSSGYRRLRAVKNCIDSSFLPDSLIYLSLDDKFSKDLAEIPPLLRAFICKGRFNRKRSFLDLPSSLEILSLGIWFDRSFVMTYLPRNLREFSFYVGNSPFDPRDLPSGLEILSLKSLIKEFDLRQLPSSLRKLRLAYDSGGKIIASHLPRSLLHLRVESLEESFRFEDLPNLLSLSVLANTDGFNLQNIKLPPSLTFLKLETRITDIGVEFLPAGLQYLLVDQVKLSEKGTSLLPRDLRVLVVDANLPSTFDLTNLPFRLRKLFVDDYDKKRSPDGIYFRRPEY